MATAKERHKANLLKYLSDPDNTFPKRDEMAHAIGVALRTLHHNFTPDELRSIEAEALENRRKLYAPQLAKVDIGLLEQAAAGDARAAKLAYQRFEGWTEKQIREISGKDGNPITHEHSLSDAAATLFSQIAGRHKPSDLPNTQEMFEDDQDPGDAEDLAVAVSGKTPSAVNPSMPATTNQADV
jgi:hypothetical protein